MCIYAENVYIQHESEEIMEFSPDLELGRGKRPQWRKNSCNEIKFEISGHKVVVCVLSKLNHVSFVFLKSDI